MPVPSDIIYPDAQAALPPDVIFTPPDHPVDDGLSDPTKSPGEGFIWSADKQRWMTPQEAQQASHDTTVQMNAERGNAEQGGILQGARTFLRGITAGWGPELTGQLSSAATGEDPQLRAEIERRQDDLNAQAHPIRNMLVHGAGGAAGILAGGEALSATPYVGPALSAVGDTIGQIPAITKYGREAALAARNAGQAAPTTLGTAATAAGLIGAPIGASEKMANEGATLGNAAAGAGEGALGGVLGGSLAHGAAGVIAPWATRGAQELIDAGVPLTIGQTMGGIAQRTESALSSTPLVGGFIRGSMNRATEGLNRVVANRALDPIGEELPQGIRPGHSTVDYVFDRLDDAFGRTLPQISIPLREAGPNTRFAADIGQIRRNAVQGGLRGEGLTYFDDLVQNVRDRLQGAADRSGTVNGEALKRIQSSLSGEGRALRNSNNPSINQVSPYVEQLRGAFNDILERENPNEAPILRAINDGYATATVLRRAANNAGTNEGVYSAAQLSRAVKAQDSSVQDTRFARGVARLQDLSSPAVPVMRTVGDSGTGERAAAMGALGVGAASHVPPGLLAAGASIPALYNPVTQSILRGAATAAPQIRNALANAVRSDLPLYGPPTYAPQLGSYVVNKSRNALHHLELTQ